MRNTGRLRAQTVTTTLITSVDSRDPHMMVNFRKQTNNQFDFLMFIVKCVANGVLRWGDTLIMDNAKIHSARLTFPAIREGLARRGISILFMPTYSPELNPCELVFSKVKFHIRETWMKNGLTFDQTIRSGFDTITLSNVQSYYQHCRTLDNVNI